MFYLPFISTHCGILTVVAFPQSYRHSQFPDTPYDTVIAGARFTNCRRLAWKASSFPHQHDTMIAGARFMNCRRPAWKAFGFPHLYYTTIQEKVKETPR